MATKHNMQQAMAAIQGRDYAEAAEILRGLVSSQPGNFKARWLLLRSLEQIGAMREVEQQLDELLRLSSRDLAKINQIASFVRSRGYPLRSVINAYRAFLERSPGSPIAVYNYAYYLGLDRQVDAALENFQRALDLEIKSPEEVHLNIANLYMNDVQDNIKARQHLEKALSLNPGYVQAYFNLGNLEEREGHRDEAKRCFEKCLEIDPNNEYALARLADAHKFESSDDPLLALLEGKAPESKNVDLLYALGRAYDQVGAYEEAWTHLSRANELDNNARPEYKQSRTEGLFRRIMARCDADWLSRFGGDSHEAVFVCGMFRTGSTLFEQILAAHPNFTAGGESEFFPRLVAHNLRNFPDDVQALNSEAVQGWKSEHAELYQERTGGKSRLTDKRPDNFLYIGLIKAILPGAKFVVTERDWRDVAVSVFSTRLGPSQGYAGRLRDIGHYLDLHRELVDHWARILGDDLIRVSYEDLVQAPKETIGGVLERLGEPWDDSVLDFANQEASVSTASVWQVREPLNPKSIGRWKRYERYFREAFGTPGGDDA
jgi:tetratricopeptide (TPR) repeat protein